MVNWSKLQPRYERIAYRIIQKHIAMVWQNLRVNNVSFATLEIFIRANMQEFHIMELYIELYQTIGLDFAKRVGKDLDILETKNTALFNEQLLREIVLYLQSNGGTKIVSVTQTLADEIIKAIMAQLGENATVIQLQESILKVIGNTQRFYRYQALRIARTETTAAAGFAAIQRAKQSNLILEKEWIAVIDDRTRIRPFDHLDMNGQKVDLDKPFFVGGQELQYPGDNNGSAGNVINCRCTIGFSGKRDANGNLLFKN
jgi:hypothetical protein